ncbi:DUF4261 domain-containing protein [Flavobacterium sp. MXW15]|uniref:DUF4261 domain-containing protein n=1 Tax=Xanthomonas chitinilytica TaxID=2989819 RepID=A0ABT3JYW6_9XANT|nr:DUF4261 domain-containing protein [Xanthomonas sp. H13-6]MCW4456044.1 DUF4261 domain-containing protein [Flavobacterium sp. MXW15]MCW4473641.1 DUF4261 domain-containing protein [Xanthomonas sp. H13-6]
MTVSLAMLLQSQPDPQLDAATLMEQLRNDWPDLDPTLLRPTPREELPADDGQAQVQSIDYGDYLIALMPVPARIGDDIEQICAHSRLWPKATPAPVDYAAHTIVTVMRPGADGTHGERIAQTALLSKVLASAVALSDEIQAVYFGSADHVVLPALFRELAREVLPAPLPLAWVAVNVGQRPEDGAMTGHTRGMDMLGLMDVEIPATGADAGEVYGRLTGICDYLIEHGQVIGDGDTLGSTAEEHIHVVYAPSALGDGRQVMRLQYEAVAPVARPWWKRLFS